MNEPKTGEGRTRVVVAGGGVAALEGALALRDLAGQRIAITMLAPEREFVYQALSVGDPFALGSAKRYPLEQVARDLDLELRRDALAAVDTGRHVVRTAAGDEVPYDALLVAVGAGREAAYQHVLTFRGQEDTEPAHGLVQDLEEGYLRRVAFVVPPGSAWSLPLYELALMTAGRMREMSVQDGEVTVVTPEDAPLSIFGAKASEDVTALLREYGIQLETGAHAEIERTGEVRLRPSGRLVQCDRVVALPRIVGRPVEGLPSDDHGFIPIDSHTRVTGVEYVYAAGDGTSFPVKQGGIACQQADVAARAIAAQAGADVEPQPFRPVLRGQLLTGGAPVFMRHDLAGGQGEEPGATRHALWWPPSKIVGAYLAPYLNEAHEAEHAREGAAEVPLDERKLGEIASRIAI